MKTFSQLLEYLLEELSSINITNPEIQQKMKDALGKHDSATFLSLFKQYAGKAKPAKWKSGPNPYGKMGEKDKSNNKHKHD